MTRPIPSEVPPWPDPPACCTHPVNSHSRERCQEPGCSCEPREYARRVAAANRPKPSEKPTEPPPEYTLTEQAAWMRGYATAYAEFGLRLQKMLDEMRGTSS